MAYIADDLVDPEDQVGGIAVLDPLPVYLGPQSELARVGDLVGGDNPGTDRGESVGALPLGPLPAAFDLKFPLGHVVHDTVTGDVFARVMGGDVPRETTNHDAELDLPIGLLRGLRDDHVVVGPTDRAGRLHEKDRLLGDRRPGLCGMRAIIEADRDDLRYPRDAWAEPRIARHQRQGARIEPLQSVERSRGESLAVDVANRAGQVSDLTLPVEQTRFFLTRGSIAQQLHRDTPLCVTV